MKKLAIALLMLAALGSSIRAGEKLRTRENFNKNWLFKRFGMHPEKPGVYIKEPQGVENSNYDDSNWRRLNLPHDWGIEGPFRDDLENATGLLPWKGIGWYRKHFIVPNSDKGKRIYIDFDGAMANAKVWLNGQYVGQWPYGYSSFRLDLTPYVRFGRENVLAVRLDTENFDSRWYPGAGLYRNVWLVKTAPVHIAHWGVYITTPQVTDKQAAVSVQVEVVNTSATTAPVTVQTVLWDPHNKKVAESGKLTADVPASASHSFRFDLSVKKPQRWDIKTPQLYTAVTTVFVKEQPTDRQETAFGIRTIEFTRNKGFLLNGRRVQIKGVCNHHDLGPLGAAFYVRAAQRQLELLKEMGCNAVRTSHNPPAPELLELCDRMGFLVMDEAFDCWRRGKRRKDYHLHFDAWHVEDLVALVRRDRNHPSVIMWSVGNEVPDQRNPSLAKALVEIVHQQDPTRPVTSGCNNSRAGFNGYQKAMDVFGYNYNLNSYERFLRTPENQNIPLIASETSSCVSSRGEYFFPLKEGTTKWKNLPGNGIFHVTSYDIQYPGWGCTPDRQFMMLEKFPQVLGEFVWTGFDYIGEPTPYNRDLTNLLNFTDPVLRAKMKKQLDKLGKIEVPSRSSYFGILDLCGFKKDRFYLYQAHWRPDLPMAHILPHWNWPERVGKVVPVHVYTSGDEAELFLNGKSLGRKKKAKYQYRLRWDEVIYEPGELRVKVWKNGKPWAEDVVRTTKAPTQLTLEVDRSTIKADGSDLAFVTVNVVDEDGLVVPRTNNLVEFEIEGPGRILATGNGDPTNHEPFISQKHRVFNGKCLVIIQSTTKPGTIKLTARSQGLKGAQIKIVTMKPTMNQQ